jgi:hypothetical protein
VKHFIKKVAPAESARAAEQTTDHKCILIFQIKNNIIEKNIL